MRLLNIKHSRRLKIGLHKQRTTQFRTLRRVILLPIFGHSFIGKFTALTFGHRLTNAGGAIHRSAGSGFARHAQSRSRLSPTRGSQSPTAGRKARYRSSLRSSLLRQRVGQRAQAQSALEIRLAAHRTPGRQSEELLRDPSSSRGIGRTVSANALVPLQPRRTIPRRARGVKDVGRSIWRPAASGKRQTEPRRIRDKADRDGVVPADSPRDTDACRLADARGSRRASDRPRRTRQPRPHENTPA